MNIDLSNRLYIDDGKVYYGYNQINIHNQKGRLFVKHKCRQINIKNIPRLPNDNDESDPVFDYIFGGGYVHYPCPAMEYWIERYRLGRKISIAQFKQKMIA